MIKMKNRFRLILVLVVTLTQVNPGYGLSAPQVAEDSDAGHNRLFF